MTRPPGSSVRVVIRRLRPGLSTRATDVVATEEPLEIRLHWQQGREELTKSVAITMRTPGDDFELAAGFLHSEGIITAEADLARIGYCTDGEEPQVYNVVTVDLRPGLDFDIHRLERHFYTTSSCGVCGKASLEAIEMRGLPPLPAVPEVDPAVIRRLPQALRSRQEVFEKTGGLHAAGLFRADGDLIYLREDVGRHNALDKLVGKLLLSKELPVVPSILLVSGRASFELVQKALVAGIPALAAVGAPSSLAVELARSRGMTLLGFVNESGFNTYSGGERMGEAID